MFKFDVISFYAVICLNINHDPGRLSIQIVKIRSPFQKDIFAIFVSNVRLRIVKSKAVNI